MARLIIGGHRTRHKIALFYVMYGNGIYAVTNLSESNSTAEFRNSMTGVGIAGIHYQTDPGWEPYMDFRETVLVLSENRINGSTDGAINFTESNEIYRIAYSHYDTGRFRTLQADVDRKFGRLFNNNGYAWMMTRENVTEPNIVPQSWGRMIIGGYSGYGGGTVGPQFYWAWPDNLPDMTIGFAFIVASNYDLPFMVCYTPAAETGQLHLHVSDGETNFEDFSLFEPMVQGAVRADPMDFPLPEVPGSTTWGRWRHTIYLVTESGKVYSGSSDGLVLRSSGILTTTQKFITSTTQGTLLWVESNESYLNIHRCTTARLEVDPTDQTMDWESHDLSSLLPPSRTDPNAVDYIGVTKDLLFMPFEDGTGIFSGDDGVTWHKTNQFLPQSQIVDTCGQ